MISLTKEQVISIFTLSGFQVLCIWELMNQYWPRHTDYYSTIISSPWYLVKTNHGLIEIGPRKRVISIDWSETGFEATNTYRLTNGDSVTVSPSMVHAWNILDAVRYMTNLFIMIEEIRASNPLSDPNTLCTCGHRISRHHSANDPSCKDCDCVEFSYRQTGEV